MLQSECEVRKLMADLVPEITDAQTGEANATLLVEAVCDEMHEWSALDDEGHEWWAWAYETVVRAERIAIRRGYNRQFCQRKGAYR